MKILRTIELVALLTLAMVAGAQTFVPLNHQPSFGAGTALLLTDGTVIVQDSATASPNHWWRLTPDNTGSYINGAWSQIASLPAGYDPLYYASAVLADGKVVIVGGEYNLGGSQDATAMAAIYDPSANTWTSFSAPANVGDAQSAVLPNGTLMIGSCCTKQQWILNESTLTWTAIGSGKFDDFSEEGWVLLPDNVTNPLPQGSILTADINSAPNSEIFEPNSTFTNGSWVTAGNTPVQLVRCAEIGPSVLRADGNVFLTGSTNNTAIYHPSTSSWSIGPTFPTNVGVPDGPAALLPNGHVLVDAGPFNPNSCAFTTSSEFFEFDGASLHSTANQPPRASVDPTFVGRMLVLPTGQIMFTDGSSDVEIYTSGGGYNVGWQPSINTYPSNITVGASWYPISGIQFNGLSQGAMYGDDVQSATNYPLVRITNNSTGHVFYAFTHNHSSMGVATAGVSISTLFDPPLTMERGLSTLVVVVNGIPSPPVTVNVF